MSNINQFPIPAIPISQVSPVSAANLTDSLTVVQSGVTGLETLQQIFNLFLPNLFLNYAGNPNGNVAGTKNQVCYDITDNILWVCTVTGTATSAVWRMCFPTLSNGQLYIGSTGNNPIAATLTAGSEVNIVNAPGSITISTSSNELTWNDVTTGSASMLPNNGYVCNGTSTTSLTLPLSASFGTTIAIIGYAHGWNIVQNNGQQILVSPNATTLGAAGSLSSTNPYDCIILQCVVANNVWNAYCVTGTGLTIV